MTGNRSSKEDKEGFKVSFNINVRGKGSSRLIEAEGICKGYGKLTLFKDSSFYINRGEKIGIIGPNGCGKTTLVKMIMGKENLDAGKLYLSQTARTAYVSQELPRGEKEIFKDLVKDWKMDEQKHIFQLMVNLGIPYERLDLAMGELSRGERMKIAIGMAVMGENDLLVLDEPTNHLDVFSREALEESLMQLPGTLLIISHDRYLLQQVCDYLLIFEEKKITRFEGKIEDYLIKKDIDKNQVDHTATQELLLLETKISRVLSDISRYKPEDVEYEALDKEYRELIQQRKRLRMNLQQ
jgi:macrolide transport system ATP-binding/permease protein